MRKARLARFWRVQRAILEPRDCDIHAALVEEERDGEAVSRLAVGLNFYTTAAIGRGRQCMHRRPRPPDGGHLAELVHGTRGQMRTREAADGAQHAIGATR